MLNIRRFRSEDAQEVAAVVAQTLRISNRADYSQAYLEASIQRMNPTFFIEKAKQTHFYLVCDADKIVAPAPSDLTGAVRRNLAFLTFSCCQLIKSVVLEN